MSAEVSRYGPRSPRRLGEQPRARLIPGPAETWATVFSLSGETKELGEFLDFRREWWGIGKVPRPEGRGLAARSPRSPSSPPGGARFWRPRAPTARGERERASP